MQDPHTRQKTLFPNIEITKAVEIYQRVVIARYGSTNCWEPPRLRARASSHSTGSQQCTGSHHSTLSTMSNCGHTGSAGKPGQRRFCNLCSAVAEAQRNMLLDFAELLEPSEKDMEKLQAGLATLALECKLEKENTVKREQPSPFSSGAANSLGGGPSGGRATPNSPSPTNSMFKFTGVGADGCGGVVVSESNEANWSEKQKQEIDDMDEYYDMGWIAGSVATVEKVFPAEMQYQYEEGRQAGLNTGYGEGYNDGYAEAGAQEEERAALDSPHYSDWEEEEDESDLGGLDGLDAPVSDEFSQEEDGADGEE